MQRRTIGVAALSAALILSCARQQPLERLEKELSQYPQYSVILQDMREEGNFIKEYYHQYRTVVGKPNNGRDSLVFRDETLDWVRVDDAFYNRHLENLGMVIAAKSPEEGEAESPYPPGYQYIGDSQYGQWRTDNDGNRFWEWYGKYAFFSALFGMYNRPVSYNDWSTYRDYRQRGRPYYGPRETSGDYRYGTTGTQTKQTNPNFYERRLARERARQTSFSEKVKNRVRRSNMSGTRSRSSRSRGGK